VTGELPVQRAAPPDVRPARPDPIVQITAFLGRACQAEELDDRLEIEAEGAIRGLVEALNGFLDKLWVKSFQLTAKQEMLEKVVEIRTNEVHEILDHVTTGFLLALRDETVLDNFSRSCVDIFRTEEIKGRKLCDLMALDERARQQFSLAYEQVFEDVLPPAVSLGQLPCEFTLHGRSYAIHGAAIPGADGQITKVFFTINDTTEIRKLEIENALRQSLIEIVRQKDSFSAFLHETSKAFDQVREAPSQLRVRNLLHTVKGNLGCFGLHEIAALVHSIEDAAEITPAHLKSVEDSLRKFLQVHRQVIGLDYPAPSVRTQDPKIERLEPVLRAVIAEESFAARQDALARALGELRWVPAGALLAPLRGMFERVAQRLEKAAVLELSGQEVLVDPEQVGTVFSSLGHLIRNSLDHGIEPAHERGAKPSCGRIRVSCRESRDAWFIEVADDGRGIDPAAVGRAAIARGRVNAEQLLAMSRTQQIRLVALDGVTTRAAATIDSGRGVGMTALFDAVTALRGDVKITSVPGEGTTVTLSIPKR